MWRFLAVASHALAVEWTPTILAASEQRIICQKLVKEVALIALGVEAEKHKAALPKDIQVFEETLHALLVGNATRNILGSPSELVKSKLEAVQSHWEVYQVLLQNVTTGDSTGISQAYKLTASIKQLLLEASDLLTAEAVADGNEVPMEFTLAERQLMLIHEMQAEAALVALGTNVTRDLEKMLQSKQLFQESHYGLLRGAEWAGVQPLSEVCLMRQMRDVTYDFKKLYTLLLQLISAPDPQQLASDLIQNITEAANPLEVSMKVATSSFIYGATCEQEVLTPSEWVTTVTLAEKQNYLMAQASQLFMQISLGYEVASSQVELTVLVEGVGAGLRNVVEGNQEQGQATPPTQEILAELLLAHTAWENLALELGRAVRSAEVSAAVVAEVARLSNTAMTKMDKAMHLFVLAGQAAGTTAPVYVIDITTRQRSLVRQLAYSAMLQKHGTSAESDLDRLNKARESFMKAHWELLDGAPETSEHPALNDTTNVCIIRQMREVLTYFELVDIAALEENMADLVRLVPLTTKSMEVAVGQYEHVEAVSCESAQLSPEEWQGLLLELGRLRRLSQQVCIDFFLNSTSAETLQESERRLKFGSRIPLVPPPYSQESFNEVAGLVPALHALQEAQNETEALARSEVLLDGAEAVAALLVQQAAASTVSSESGPLAFPAARLDLASRQVMLAHRIFKERLLMIYANATNNTNATDGAWLSASIAAFETAQEHLKTGGAGLPPVILSREDILDQWDNVMAAWQVFKAAVDPGSSDVSLMSQSLATLSRQLEIALPLYAMPDEVLPPDYLWPILVYSAIAVFALATACSAVCLLCCYRRKQLLETGAKL